MAIDRNIIAEQLYGSGGVAACNVVNGPPINVSPNNDDCLNAGHRTGRTHCLMKPGSSTATATASVKKTVSRWSSCIRPRPTPSARVPRLSSSSWWEEIGVETELRNIDAAVFFGGDPASPDTYQKFFADVEMFTSGTDGTDAETFMVRWICGNEPTPDNGWLGRNVPRHCDSEYDALFEELAGTGDPARRNELTIQLNDILIRNGALVPLVFRGNVAAQVNSLEGTWINGWDSELWNIEDWSRS